MTLPITESILRGELRPNILSQALEQKELEQLIRNARKVSQKSGLMELELAINGVLSNLVGTQDIYQEERKTRDAALHAREHRVFKGDVEYKYLTSEIIISDVLTLPELKTPLLRFYNTILDAEVLRTRQALLYLSRAVQDDAFMRSTLKAIFRKIKFYCREAIEWKEQQAVMALIPVKLTHLYFTLLNTYGEILESFETPEYEDDFMDFVFDWKREYPSEQEETKYRQQCGVKTAIGNNINDMPDSEKTQEQPHNEERHAKDKADKFLDAVAEYNFLEMPMIKQLKTKEKVHDLIMTMLENPGHACAMLDHLKFFDWIKNTQRTKFTKTQYDSLCSKIVMDKEAGAAFHTVRMSLNKNNQNAEKYRAYAYVDQVATEYIKALNS